MYPITAFLLICLSLCNHAFADVHLAGELVIQEGYSSAKYLGEVINETDGSVTNVKIIIVAEDASNNPIDVSSGYVDGYTEPDGYSDSFIPPHTAVPFLFYADVPADSIATYNLTITYNESNKIFTELAVVSNISTSEDWLRTTYYGEITNISQKPLNYVGITFAFKDAEGKLIDVGNTYVDGCTHIPSDGTIILSGQNAPFDYIWAPEGDNLSYYTIVTYTVEDDPVEQFGINEILVDGELSVLNYDDKAKFIGYLANNTSYDIYFVELCFILRDSDGKIINISTGYVEGTNYAYSQTGTTDTHIAPFNKAPFDISTSAPFDKLATYEYRVYFYKADTPTGIAGETPVAFVLKQNYPNPFNPVTTIEYSIPQNGHVTLTIYNISGQSVSVLKDEYHQAGKHTITWNAKDLPTGLYFCTLKANGFTETRKMVLVK